MKKLSWLIAVFAILALVFGGLISCGGNGNNGPGDVPGDTDTPPTIPVLFANGLWAEALGEVTYEGAELSGKNIRASVNDGTIEVYFENPIDILKYQSMVTTATGALYWYGGMILFENTGTKNKGKPFELQWWSGGGGQTALKYTFANFKLPEFDPDDPDYDAEEVYTEDDVDFTKCVGFTIGSSSDNAQRLSISKVELTEPLPTESNCDCPEDCPKCDGDCLICMCAAPDFPVVFANGLFMAGASISNATASLNADEKRIDVEFTEEDNWNGSAKVNVFKTNIALSQSADASEFSHIIVTWGADKTFGEMGYYTPLNITLVYDQSNQPNYGNFQSTGSLSQNDKGGAFEFDLEEDEAGWGGIKLSESNGKIKSIEVVFEIPVDNSPAEFWITDILFATIED